MAGEIITKKEWREGNFLYTHYFKNGQFYYGRIEINSLPQQEFSIQYIKYPSDLATK